MENELDIFVFQGVAWDARQLRHLRGISHKFTCGPSSAGRKSRKSNYGASSLWIENSGNDSILFRGQHAWLTLDRPNSTLASTFPDSQETIVEKGEIPGQVHIPEIGKGANQNCRRTA